VVPLRGASVNTVSILSSTVKAVARDRPGSAKVTGEDLPDVSSGNRLSQAPLQLKLLAQFPYITRSVGSEPKRAGRSLNGPLLRDQVGYKNYDFQFTHRPTISAMR
jgi:hypothetical protein